MGAAMSANGAKATRQTGGDFTPGAETSVFNEAFTAEVCDALYLKAPRLIKRMQRVPTREIRLAGRRCKYSAMLMRGVYPWDPKKACQDSFFVNESMVVDGLASHWFAVMDGHGPDGDGCAHFIRDNLEKVARKLHKKHPEMSWADVLTRSYETVNEMLHSSTSVGSVDSGSTLVSVVVRRDTVYCANVGDSRAIIGTADRDTGGVRARPLSSDQTPYRKDERERLREAGARVLAAPPPGPPARRRPDHRRPRRLRPAPVARVDARRRKQVPRRMTSLARIASPSPIRRRAPAPPSPAAAAPCRRRVPGRRRRPLCARPRAPARPRPSSPPCTYRSPTPPGGGVHMPQAVLLGVIIWVSFSPAPPQQPQKILFNIRGADVCAARGAERSLRSASNHPSIMHMPL